MIRLFHINYCFSIFILLFSFQLLGSVQQKLSYKDNKLEDSGTVATVNGIPITLLDVLKVCGREELKMPYMYDEKEMYEQIHVLRTVTLENLIKRKLVFCDFMSKGYQFPVGFMLNYLDRIAVSNKLPNAEALKQMVEKDGGNFEDFKREAFETAAVNSLVYNKCYKNVFITPEEVYNYYNKYKDKYTKPAQIELQALKLDRKGIHRKELDEFSEKIKNELKNANLKKFHEYVLMYSEGPNNKNSGDIGWIPKDKLRKDFAKALKNAEIGDIVGPVKAEEAYYFLRVNNFKGSFTEPYRYVREDIKEELTQNMRQKEYDSYIDSLRRKADIKYF